MHLIRGVPFTVCFMNFANGLTDDGPMTKVQTLSTDWILSLTDYKSKSEPERHEVSMWGGDIWQFKEVVKSRFDRPSKDRLYTLEFHRPDDLLDDIAWP